MEINVYFLCSLHTQKNHAKILQQENQHVTSHREKDGQRAVVGPKDLVPDSHVADGRVHEPLGGHEVVEAPTNVFAASVHHVSPESVALLAVRVEVTEGVNKVALLQKGGEACKKE